MEKVLITGASGLLGTRLTELLLAKGYSVNTLGRGGQQTAQNSVQHFAWNVLSGTIDKRALEGVTAVIHLAGAGIADQRWSKKRKLEVIESRVKGARLIFDHLQTTQHTVATFISASAVGYYGDCGNTIVNEEHKQGEGFLAEVCWLWEEAAKIFRQLNIREVRCRIGIVLAKDGGALPELTRTIPFGFANWFAKEDLYYPWIHLDDVCGIFIHALESKQVAGAYNASAPSPLLMKDLMKEILKARNSKALLLPAPPSAINLVLGEMSQMVLNSQRCSAAKIMATGYRFKYGEIKDALANIYVMSS